MSDYCSTKAFTTPQAAFDWASAMFSNGGFKIQTSQGAFYLMTVGGFCLFTLPKAGVPRG